jgi:very-short-patch-repair endonuclease
MPVMENQFIEIKPLTLACYYKSLGYVFEKSSEKITINALDLPPKSNFRVKCVCDKCNVVFERRVSKIIDRNKTFCKKHKYEQYRITNLEKYGVENTSQLIETQQKKEKTCLERYNETHPMKVKKIQKKAETTTLKRYGVKHPLQNKNILEKYREKIMNNLVVPDSKQQEHIGKILNGKMNETLKGYHPDIVLNNNLIVEYDGGGHWNSVIAYHDLTMKEFYKKNKIRENVFTHNGYKIIRIIGRVGIKDIIPSDEIIKNTIGNIENNLNNKNGKIARWYLFNNVIIYE